MRNVALESIAVEFTPHNIQEQIKKDKTASYITHKTHKNEGFNKSKLFVAKNIRTTKSVLGRMRHISFFLFSF